MLSIRSTTALLFRGMADESWFKPWLLRRAGTRDRALHPVERAVHVAEILGARGIGAAALEHVARLRHHGGVCAIGFALFRRARLADALHAHQRLEEARLGDGEFARACGLRDRSGRGGRGREGES